MEDDQPFADSLALTLGLEGHDVLVAVGADEGIQLGLAHCPDVVIADWMLRDHLVGGEVCRRICDVHPRTKCIVMTGYLDALPEVARRSVSIEAAIAKPFHKEDILDAVNRALGGVLIREPGHSCVDD